MFAKLVECVRVVVALDAQPDLGRCNHVESVVELVYYQRGLRTVPDEIVEGVQKQRRCR